MRQNKEKNGVPAECLERVEEAIERAKKDKLQEKRARRKAAVRAAAIFLVCLAVVIPNVSAEAALAMSRLPVVGDLFRVITVRDYHYIDDRYSADVHVPKLDSDSEAARSVNSKINAIAENWVEEFEKSMEDGWIRSDMKVDYEILSTAPEYFTLKLVTYQSSGSGFEQDYYYTIRISDEKEMALADLFPKGADYITPISENIIEQMHRQMKDDADKIYWVDLEEDDPIKEFEFKAISEEQQFYVDEEGRVVIAFNEGDVAPMYMGCVKFTVPKQVTDNIK